MYRKRFSTPVRKERKILTSFRGGGSSITKNWRSVWLVARVGTSFKPLLLTNSSLADLEILITLELTQAIFMRVLLSACLSRVRGFGAFTGWIQMAQLSFLQLKVRSPDQSDCFADTISITVFPSW